MFLVVGVGNILLSDEGIGVHLVRDIEKENIFENTIFVDLGTSSFDIISYLNEDSIFFNKKNDDNLNGKNYKKYKNYKNFESHSKDIKKVDKDADNKRFIEKLVIIDSIIAKDISPGSVLKLSLEDLKKRQKTNFSLHQIELVDSLKLSMLDSEFHQTMFPQTMILGVVPYNISKFSIELSSKLKILYPNILEKVKREIISFFNPSF